MSVTAAALETMMSWGILQSYERVKHKMNIPLHDVPFAQSL